MLKDDAKRFAGEIFAAYPEVALRAQTEEIYVNYLAELDRAAVAEVVPDLIRTSPRLPTIADVRRRLAEVQLGLPSPLEAYHTLFEAGAERHPLTRYVADIFGGEYNIKTSEAPGATRTQFIRFYEELLDEAVRRGALPRVVTEAAARHAAQPEASPEQPGVWAAIRERFDALPDDERAKRVKEARKRLLKSGDVGPDWLARPVIEHEALRAFAAEEGWLEEAS